MTLGGWRVREELIDPDDEDALPLITFRAYPDGSIRFRTRARADLTVEVMSTFVDELRADLPRLRAAERRIYRNEPKEAIDGRE